MKVKYFLASIAIMDGRQSGRSIVRGWSGSLREMTRQLELMRHCISYRREILLSHDHVPGILLEKALQ